MINPEYKSEFLAHFNGRDKEIAIQFLRMGLIHEISIRNYNIVLELKKMQFHQGLSYTKSISIQAEKYQLSERMIRNIYTDNKFCDKIKP